MRVIFSFNNPGYDISNYTDIHYEFGTLADFDNLIKKANELGIKIIMDLVPNHSSNEHPWFIKSENREEGYEDYYVWADPDKTTGGPPNNWVHNTSTLKEVFLLKKIFSVKYF